MAPWFLRDEGLAEFTGDYEANCYLNVFSPPNEFAVEFRADKCKFHSDSYYCQPVMPVIEPPTTTEAPTEPPGEEYFSPSTHDIEQPSIHGPDHGYHDNGTNASAEAEPPWAAVEPPKPTGKTWVGRGKATHYKAVVSWPAWAWGRYPAARHGPQSLCLSEDTTTNGQGTLFVSCCNSAGKGLQRNCKEDFKQKSHEEAVAFCESSGNRLCTEDEVLNGATVTKGCLVDGPRRGSPTKMNLAWTSVACKWEAGSLDPESAEDSPDSSASESAEDSPESSEEPAEPAEEEVEEPPKPTGESHPLEDPSQWQHKEWKPPKPLPIPILEKPSGETHPLQDPSA